MSSCPSDEQLLCLLDDELDQADEQARIAELATSSDPAPIEPDHAGCSQAQTDVDVPKAPDRAATAPPSRLWGVGGRTPGAE
jgi:hypothetical protein